MQRSHVRKRRNPDQRRKVIHDSNVGHVTMQKNKKFKNKKFASITGVIFKVRQVCRNINFFRCKDKAKDCNKF